MRASTLGNNVLAINREIDSRYDAVIAVRDKLPEIELVAGMDLDALIAELENAQDFTGITVVSGTEVAWDAVNKVLTVPRGEQGVKGDKGDIGLQGPQGPRGLNGPKGDSGKDGKDGKDLTVTQIVYNSDGTFTWMFSDGTNYVTPNLKGDQGAAGDKGDKGISVHHLKGTSTTDPEGDFGTFGELDTYTFYGDAHERLNLGHFVMRNGITSDQTESLGLMRRSTFDKNNNGVIDDSERLGGELPEHYVNVLQNQDIAGIKTFTNDVIVSGNLVVNGTATIVNSETVTTKGNQIMLNSGEVGAGVTAGKAGIVIDRGTATNYEFVFVEADDSFKIGESGSLQTVATREDSPLDTGVAIWNGVENRFDTVRDVNVDSVILGGGTLSWNSDEGTLDIDTGAGIIIQAGQENNRLVRNNTTSVITNGTVVMLTGSIGNSGRLTVAPADGVQGTAMRVYGVVTQDILPNTDGYVTIDGKVRNIGTTGSIVGETWVDGDILYLKPNDAGKLTKVEPIYGEIKIPVANVVHAHTNGTLDVRIIPLDENSYEPRNNNIQAHITRVDNPHNVTKAQVGLGNADNTADVDKNVLSATKLTTPRSITISGEVVGSVSFDGSTDVNISTTIQHLDASKITSGIIDAARLPAYVDDVLEYANLSAFPAVGETGKIYIALDTNKAYRWSGSIYVYITSGAVDSVAGKTGVVSLAKGDVGLANVDNTSDIDKPISTATQTALNTKIDTTGDQTIAGVKTFSSSPIVPTPTTNTQAANKAYVDTNIGPLSTDYYQGPYGFSWDSVTDTYIRTGAKGYTSIQSKMRRCVLYADGSVNYYLHPDNSNFKEDGTPSVLTGANGNVMVEIPKHYIKVETVGDVDSFSISLTEEPGYVLDPSFMKWNGTKMVEVPYRYFRAYEGFVSGGKLLSVSGVTPTRSQTIATFRTQAMANGAGWHLTDWNLLNTIKRLCYIEFCDFIVTKYLGEGNHTGSDFGITTGQSNALGNRSSNSTHIDKYMSYRGIENMYADIWEFVDGVNVNNYQFYVNGNYSTFQSGVFTGNYVAKGPLVAAGASNSLIKRCAVSADGGFIPTVVGGSTTTFYGDALWSATGAIIAYYGGHAADGLSGGLGALVVDHASSFSHATIGAAVCS